MRVVSDTSPIQYGVSTISASFRTSQYSPYCVGSIRSVCCQTSVNETETLIITHHRYNNNVMKDWVCNILYIDKILLTNFTQKNLTILLGSLFCSHSTWTCTVSTDTRIGQRYAYVGKLKQGWRVEPYCRITVSLYRICRLGGPGAISHATLRVTGHYHLTLNIVTVSERDFSWGALLLARSSGPVSSNVEGIEVIEVTLTHYQDAAQQYLLTHVDSAEPWSLRNPAEPNSWQVPVSTVFKVLLSPDNVPRMCVLWAPCSLVKKRRDQGRQLERSSHFQHPRHWWWTHCYFRQLRLWTYIFSRGALPDIQARLSVGE